MIVLTGGKTGGHIMPLVTLSYKLKDVCYIGATNSLEEKICREHNIKFIGLDIKRNNLLQIIKAFFSLKIDRPSFVFSTGGYVSLPVLIYAVLHRIPIYLLEENVIMGSTNRFISFFAKRVFLTYEINNYKDKYELVGLPIRPPSVSFKYAYLDFDVLIIGGSLGSKPLCELVYELNSKYRICLLAGSYSKNYQNIKNVIVFDYVSDIYSLMYNAKVVITRAGASTTYELFSINKPSIVIPSMKTKKNHQYLNALYFADKGCCKLVKEKNAKEEIVSSVESILNNKQLQINMMSCQRKLIIKDSASKIVKSIRQDIKHL